MRIVKANRDIRNRRMRVATEERRASSEWRVVWEEIKQMADRSRLIEVGW